MERLFEISFALSCLCIVARQSRCFSRQFLDKLNTFSAYLELLRQTMSGKIPELFYWYYAGITVIVGAVMGLVLMLPARVA